MLLNTFRNFLKCFFSYFYKDGLDGNEKWLEMFAYPSNSCVFLWTGTEFLKPCIKFVNCKSNIVLVSNLSNSASALFFQRYLVLSQSFTHSYHNTSPFPPPPPTNFFVISHLDFDLKLIFSNSKQSVLQNKTLAAASLKA